MPPERSNESLEDDSQSSFIARTEQEQPPTPTVIISEASPPNLRPKIILKIRQATERREKAKVMRDTERGMEIDEQNSKAFGG